jgi:hypothetical protein
MKINTATGRVRYADVPVLSCSRPYMEAVLASDPNPARVGNIERTRSRTEPGCHGKAPPLVPGVLKEVVKEERSREEITVDVAEDVAENVVMSSRSTQL